MTRTMGDATGAAAGSLPAGLDLYAGYVTGTPDIQWTRSQLLLANVTIDQGFQSPPVTTAIVRDVEPGAWTPAQAVNRDQWTAVRPTIYCDRADLPAVLSGGWRGDLWLAIPNWQPGQPLPATPGCTVVAVQNDFSNPNYDLSVVLDPTWPEGDLVPLTAYQPGSVTMAWFDAQLDEWREINRLDGGDQ